MHLMDLLWFVPSFFFAENWQPKNLRHAMTGATNKTHTEAVPSVTDRPALDPKLSQGHPPGCGDLELTHQTQPTG